jgi:hypothetical protein
MSQFVKTGRLLTVRSTAVEVIAGLTVVFFTLCSALSWWAGQGGVAPWFLIFVALGALLLVKAGSVEMNQEFISHKNLWARHLLKWEDVDRIEMDAQGGAMVFLGGEKRLALLGPAYWSGRDKTELLALLACMIEEKKIAVRQTRSALFKLSKNVRARRVEAAN